MPQNVTTSFPADLDDATKWRVVRGVPVFKPHTRVLPEFRDPTGKVWPEIKIAVAAKDLPYIAEATNKAGPQPMRCGHVVQDPSYPEKLQPPIEGWEKNHKPGQFSQDGGKTWEPCVTADLYYRAAKFDEIGPEQYPFRSVDYDFVEKKLTGLALLRRRPFLDLGVIPYLANRHGGTVVQYAFESGAAQMDDDKFTPEEEAQYAKICRYMAKKHPRMAAYMEGHSAPYSHPVPDARYADMETRLAKEQALRLLADVKGKVAFDETREAAIIASLPEAQRAAHVQYMLTTYRPLAGPTTPVVPVATGTQTAPAPTSADARMTENQMNAALAYQAASSIPYEAARLWALSNIKG